MDRMMENSFLGPENYQQSLAMPMDVCETEDAYEIEASMPGVTPENLEITMDRNTLTIRGEVKSDVEKEDKTYHMRERRGGVFVRSITLPSNVDPNSVQANYEHGVLRVKVPKTEEAKPKRIQIQSGSSSKVIEGKSKNQ